MKESALCLATRNVLGTLKCLYYSKLEESPRNDGAEAGTEKNKGLKYG